MSTICWRRLLSGSVGCSDDAIVIGCDDGVMQAPPEDTKERALGLVTGCLVRDSEVIHSVLSDGGGEDYRWVALALANLVAVYVEDEARLMNREPLEVWSGAIAKMNEAGT